jgi:hypothetical protein
MDRSGAIYGTTRGGGVYTNNCQGPMGCGVVYRLTRSVSKKAGRAYNVIYRFCSFVNCPDGADAFGRPLIGRSGILYGTTAAGGSAGRRDRISAYAERRSDSVGGNCFVQFHRLRRGTAGIQCSRRSSWKSLW